VQDGKADGASVETMPLDIEESFLLDDQSFFR
jgi:hypothetical protein